MIAELENINWDSYQQTFGCSNETIAQIRILTSSEPEEREDAFDALLYSFMGQHWVEEESLPVISILAELAIHPKVSDKPLILHLICNIVHAERGASHTHADLLLTKSINTPDLENSLAESELSRKMQERLVKHFPAFVRLLDHPDQDIHYAVIRLIALQRGMDVLDGVVDPVVSEQIFEHFIKEGDEVLRSGYLSLFCSLNPQSCQNQLLDEFEKVNSKLSQLVAAILLVSHEGPNPRSVIDFLCDTFLHMDLELIESYDDFCALTYRAAYLNDMATLVALADSMAAERCLPVMIENVNKDITPLPLRELMMLAFWRDGCLCTENPNDLQKKAVLAVARKSFVRLVDQTRSGWAVLSEFGLPTTREGIDAYLDLPNEEHQGFTLRRETRADYTHEEVVARRKIPLPFYKKIAFRVLFKLEKLPLIGKIIYKVRFFRDLWFLIKYVERAEKRNSNR